MARERETTRGQYGDVVARLTEIVQALEGGSLSLEESLERFAEGVQLVKAGETLLNDAERRIEQLLSGDGRSAPLQIPEAQDPPSASPASPSVSPSGSAAVAPPARTPRRPAPPPPAPKADEDLDDVPF